MHKLKTLSISGLLATMLLSSGVALAGDPLLDGNVQVANGNHTVTALLALIGNGTIPANHVFPTVQGTTITAGQLQALYNQGQLVTLNQPLVGATIDNIVANYDPALVNIDLRPAVYGKPFANLTVIDSPLVLGANAKPAVVTTVRGKIGTLIDTGGCVLDRAGKCMNVVDIVTDPVGTTIDTTIEKAMLGNPAVLIGGSLLYISIAPSIANAGAEKLFNQAIQLEPAWQEAFTPPIVPHSIDIGAAAGQQIMELHSMPLDAYTPEDLDFMEEHYEYFIDILAELRAMGRL